MTLQEAIAAHDEIPAGKRNDNCVLDAQWRLRDALKLARQFYTLDQLAPSYVTKAVSDLRSWL